MRKTLMPLVASLALCGGVTGLLIATNANAQQSAAARNPVMLALAGPAPAAGQTAVPPSESGAPDMMRGARRAHICKDLYARKVGEMAFLEAKLSLTPAQAPLFTRWKQVKLDTARQHQDRCATFQFRKAGERPTVLDRLAMEEKFLKNRLTDLQAERPALAALYASLTPEQQAELGHGRMGRAGMMHRMGPRGAMGHGALGHGPAGAPPPAR